ncbi:MAG: UbiA family prenyltransferase [Hyphomicrobiales bacterium]
MAAKSRTRKRRQSRERSASPVPAPSTAGRTAPRRLAAVRLVHPFPSLLVTALTLALVPLADRGAPGSLYAELGLGMLCYQFAIGVTNDIADAELDAATKPWKAIPAGAISSRAATMLAALLAGAGLVVTLPLDFGPWLIGLAGLSLGLLYDVALKRSSLSFVPWALAFPLIPVWVFSAAGAWEPLLWWTFPLGFVLGIAVQLANQSPDAREDREGGVRGVAQRLGSRRSARLSLALFGAGSSAAVVILLFADPAWAGLCAATATVALLLAPRAVRFFGRDGLFGLLAASSALLAVLFLSAV